MFMRDMSAFQSGLLITHRKELRSFGLTDKLLRRVCGRCELIRISVITASGEIRDL